MSMVHHGMLIARSGSEESHWAEREVREFARTENSDNRSILTSGPSGTGPCESEDLRLCAAPDMVPDMPARGDVSTVNVLSVTRLVRRVLPRAGTYGGR